MLNNTYSKIKAIKYFLKSNTNKNNPMSLKILSNNLQKNFNLVFDRKTLQKYLNILIDEEDCIGIVGSASATAYFYKRSNEDFSLMEEKIIYDSVSNLACLPDDLVSNLKNKIIKNTYLEDKILVEKPLKIHYCTTCNDELSITKTFNNIFESITNKQQLIFDYMRLNGDKQWIVKLHNKAVCPIAIILNNGKYYLHSYLPDEDKTYNFRIDRMLNVEVLNISMIKIPAKYSFDFTNFKQTNFNMFAGEKKRLTLQFDEELTNQICDKFGKNCEIERDLIKPSKNNINVEIEVGNTFYAWLTNYQGKIKIVFPEIEIKNYLNFLKNTIKSYSNQ